MKMDLDKKKVLIVSGIANIIVFVIILINIIVLFPLTIQNAWIYGLYILAAGIVVYLTGLFLVDRYYLEFVGTIVTIIGEMFIVAFFGINFPVWGTWISNYLILPSVTFFVMILIAYYYGKDELENKKAINISLMLVSGSLFFLMIEAALRIPELFQSAQIPIWAIIIITGGLLLYGFTTWKLFEGGSYIMALTGAFIVNIGVIMLELYYRIDQITGLVTILLLPPAGVFFVLILINYKISPHD